MSVTRTQSPGSVSEAAISSLIVEPVTTEATAALVSTVIPSAGGSALRVPRVIDDDSTANLFAGEGNELELLSPEVAQITFQYKKVGGIVPVTAEAIQDAHNSGGTILDLVGRSLVRKATMEIDRAAFGGAAPADGFAGIRLSHTAFHDAGETDGADIDAFIDAVAAVRGAGGVPSVILTDPVTAATLQKAKTSVGSNVPLYGANAAAPIAETINGLPVLTSKHVEAGKIYVIDKAGLILAVHKQVTLDVDNSVFFTTDSTAIRLTLRAAFGVVDPSKIAVATLIP